MGPTWVLSAPDGPHVGPMNLAIRVHRRFQDKILCSVTNLVYCIVEISDTPFSMPNVGIIRRLRNKLWINENVQNFIWKRSGWILYFVTDPRIRLIQTRALDDRGMEWNTNYPSIISAGWKMCGICVQPAWYLDASIQGRIDVVVSLATYSKSWASSGIKASLLYGW